MAHFSKTNLIVNYLPQNMSEDDLSAIFSRYGELLTCRIVKDHKTGYSFGYGFVNYATEQEATHAIDALNGLPIASKRIKVSLARPPGEALKDTNLYVTNLPRDYNEHDLELLFAPFGNIVQRKLLHDRITGMPRGVAFVRYDTKDEADAAVSALNGQVIGDSLQPLQVRVAEEHGKQKAAYYAGLKLGRSMGMRGSPRPLMRGRGNPMGRPMMSRFNPMSAPRIPFNTFY